jgi:hypothetical protein
MPNWVYNKMVVSGGTATDRASEQDNWYDWNISNWGTKWDAGDQLFEASDTELVYYFNTAWSPPLGVMNAFIKNYPQLEFTFTYEEEQGWGGVITRGSDGELETVKEWDIPDTHAEIARRGGVCFCSDTAQVFEDCFSERARLLDTISDRVREAAVSLANGWEGTFDELVTTATSLSTEQTKTN